MSETRSERNLLNIGTSSRKLRGNQTVRADRIRLDRRLCSRRRAGSRWLAVCVEAKAGFQRRAVIDPDCEGSEPALLLSGKDAIEDCQGDVFFCYVYLDARNPPTEIMLQFNDGSWEHRAYWGADSIDWGKKDSPPADSAKGRCLKWPGGYDWKYLCQKSG